MPDAWNPDQYERFKAQRREPFDDLLSLTLLWQYKYSLEKPRVLDLGCGTGELTAELHESTSAKETLGIDSSGAMLERAPKGVKGLTFQQANIADFAPPSPYQIVYTNAALQWVPDHPSLIKKVAGWVAPGGLLAVQVPSNHDHPSHTLAAELAKEEPYKNALDGFYRVSPVLAPEEYARHLHRLEFEPQAVRLHVYGHILPGPEHVIEWVKGTNLTDYEKRMPAELYQQFLSDYAKRLLPILGDEKPHFYPFKRILFIGRKPK